MITYTDEEAGVYTGIIAERQHYGLLQAWTYSENLVRHAEWLLHTFWYRGLPSEDVAEPKTPSTVLDVGCGTGELLFQAGETWPEAKLIGVNKFPKQMCWLGSDYDVQLMTYDFEKQPPDRTMNADLAMITYTLGHFDDLVGVLTNVRASMAAGGHLGIYDIHRRSVLYPEVFGYRLYSRREIARALMFAGFKEIRWFNTSLAQVTLALEDSAREEFKSKTIPFLLTAEA